MNYFRYKQFDKDVITVAVGYYLRYALSYRDISEILRNVVLMFIIQPFIDGFKSMHLFSINFGRENIKTYYKWRIDETYIKIKGQWCYLYRAIDADGHTLDIWLRKNEIINQHMRLLSALLNNSVNLK